jgi:hypothetical protein
MSPVLPCFAGRVPRAFVKRYPNASYRNLHCYANLNSTWSCEVMLNPTDPLFNKVAKLWMATQAEGELMAPSVVSSSQGG